MVAKTFLKEILNANQFIPIFELLEFILFLFTTSMIKDFQQKIEKCLELINRFESTQFLCFIRTTGLQNSWLCFLVCIVFVLF